MQSKAPVIISASRATDIPAFYGDWFISRLKAGHVSWKNPFNNLLLTVSFENARAIVFWTKNAAPMLKHLPELDSIGINYYFNHTLNDYEAEGLEPGVPPLSQRIETFRELSRRLGKERVIWRFDPLVLSQTISVKMLLEKLHRVGCQLHGYTEKLVISFIDIDSYKKVQRNLSSSGMVDCREFTPEEMEELADGLQNMNQEWGLAIGTCAEPIDLSKYGIQHNKCIDDDLMVRLFSHDRALMNHLGYSRCELQKQGKTPKDSNQRKACGCVSSKDIGQYSTCVHLCAYCYANSSTATALSNHRRHMETDKNCETIVPIT